MPSGVFLEDGQRRAEVIVGLVGQVGHQLVLLQASLGRVLMAHLECLVARRRIVQRLQAHICDVRAADALTDALPLHPHRSVFITVTNPLART